MESSFNHSIKVPSQYKKAAKILKKSLEQRASLKGLIYSQQAAKTGSLSALITKISKNKPILDDLIERSQILVNEPRLDQYICNVLMTELLFGAGKLNGLSKPVQCVLKYKDTFNKILEESSTKDQTKPKGSGKSLTDKPRYIRINTNIFSRKEALEAFSADGWQEISNQQLSKSYDKFLQAIHALGEKEFISDIHVKNLFIFPANSKKIWATHLLVRECKLMLQDKASCLPPHLLMPPKDSVILDMCAAPGMKTTQLASMIKNKGQIYAVEHDSKRYKTLCDLVKNTMSTCVKPIHQDVLKLKNVDVPNVQYILVDPTCSGSGMADALFASTREYDTKRLTSLGGLQIKILFHAMTEFPQARKIVYSTCSTFTQENEHVVQRILELCPTWELIKPLEFSEKWKHFGSPKFKYVGKKCICSKRNVDLTDGFFVAIFQRKSIEIIEVDNET